MSKFYPEVSTLRSWQVACKFSKHYDETLIEKAISWALEEQLNFILEWLDSRYEMEYWWPGDRKKFLVAVKEDMKDTDTPCLKQQALESLRAIASNANDMRDQYYDFKTVQEALRRLPDH